MVRHFDVFVALLTFSLNCQLSVSIISKPPSLLYSDKPSQNGRNFRVKGKAFGYLEFIATVDLDDLFIVSKE